MTQTDVAGGDAHLSLLFAFWLLTPRVSSRSTSIVRYANLATVRV